MRCPKCSKVNPEDSNFCNGCGVSVSEVTQKQAHTFIPEAERKRVTALFSDLSGFTAMTGKNDPELIKEITSTIFNGIKKIIKNYDGFIERFAGDGGLALFGVPKAHENDPIRAINAAIDIHKFVKSISPRYEAKVGTRLSMHSGINTGLAVTADVNPDKGTHGVTGNAINIAARLSDLASAHEIFVGQETYKICKNNFSFESLPPTKVKGKTDPIHLYKVLTTRKSTSRMSTGRQISSEMVGRDKELNKLELQVAKVVNGQGSIVNIIGEAGIGKSRLFAEFENLEILKKTTLVEGKSISIGSNLPFHPIADFLKQYAQITEDDTENIASGKLEFAIREIEKNEADEIFPFIALLMGMNLSGRHLERVKGIEGEALEKLIFKSLRDFLICISAIRPLIIALEDLHWADASSISLLESMFSISQTHPILFINLFRPNFKETGERVKHTLDKNYPDHSSNIQLAPLDKNLSESLINNMLMIKGMPAQHKEKIIKRTGGNPFFMEEVVRSLIDQGAIIVKDDKFEIISKIDDIHIPGTINDLLTARIDRLEDKTRQLVKIASVVGRHFYHKILAQVATTIEDLDQHLTYLKDIQLIREQERFSELEYIFKHALAQEAAYNSILLKKRKQIHLQVADSIEDIFKDRIHEFYGMLAMHYTRGENLEKAEYYLVKAGEEAMRSSASDEALRYYQEGLKFYQQLNKDAIDTEKAAMFEKNIALVFYNKSRFNAAIPHFDKVFEYWGIPTHPNKIKTLPVFLKNIFLIRTGLCGLFKGQDPSKRDEQILNILFKLGFALAVDDFNRASKIAIYMFNMAYTMNLSKASDAVNVIMGFACVIAIKKLTYNLPLKLLQICYEKMDQNNIKNMVNYRFFHSIICFYAGDWDKIEKNDIKIVNKACKEGKLESATNYLWQAASVSMNIGDFHNAQIMISMLPKIAREYDYGLATLHNYSQKAQYYLIKRELNNAIKLSKKSVEISRFQNREDFECGWLGLQAESLVLLNDLKEAQKIINKVKSIAKSHKSINPILLWHSHYSRFYLKTELLRQKKASKNRQGMEELKKDALQYSKDIFKIYKNYVPCLPMFFKMNGDLYWLIDKQKAALRWWTKSIKIGEKLGAKPDLSRTYFEVGKSLISPQSKFKELNDIRAQEYLDKAKIMFEEMDLQWDLNELEKVSMAN